MLKHLSAQMHEQELLKIFVERIVLLTTVLFHCLAQGQLSESVVVSLTQ